MSDAANDSLNRAAQELFGSNNSFAIAQDATLDEWRKLAAMLICELAHSARIAERDMDEMKRRNRVA